MSILKSYSEIPNNNVIVIPNWKDITVNPDAEKYLLENYDRNYFTNVFEEMADTLIQNTDWIENTKIYYMIKGFTDYLKNNLLVELANIYDFFDLFILKYVTVDEINATTDQTEKDKLNNYYIRFFELFQNYASFLKSYLDIFENNQNVVNNLKKDLLIYYNRTIYNMRGNKKGYQYLENILSPITAINQQTGVKTKFNINIAVEEWGEFTGVVSDKIMYMYKLVLTNISNKDIKTGILNILTKVLHPAGYKLMIQDISQFLIPLSFNVKMISQQLQEQDTTFFTESYDFQTDMKGLVTPVDGSLFNFNMGTTQYNQRNNLDVNNASITTLLSYSG